MTQAINFSELKDAFAPIKRSSGVTDINGNPVSNNHDKQKNQDLVTENQRLSDVTKALNEQLESVEAAYQKTLRHVNSMMQQKMEFDDDFQRLHEDKIRLIRTIKNKQQDNEVLNKSIHKLNSENQKLKTSLTNSKHSNAKLKAQIESQKNEVKSLKSMMKRMTVEMAQLKEVKTLKHQVTEKWHHLVDVLMAYAAHAKDRGLKLLPTKTNSLPSIQWFSVYQSLPSKQGMFYVRNETESDVAVFNPETRRFKCSHKPIEIQDWAPIA